VFYLQSTLVLFRYGHEFGNAHLRSLPLRKLQKTSVRVRQKLKLSPSSPLDPFRHAELLGVSVVAPKDLSDLPEDIQRRFVADHRNCWSAITVTDGRGRLIVTNPFHALTRLNSSLAHEIAHIILGHEPSMMFMTRNSGMTLRNHNEEQDAANAAFAARFTLTPHP
jgi:IrrE N-terminal-like domain